MSLKNSVLPAIAPAARPARTWLVQAGMVLMGTLVLAVSAQISIPMWPVPLTMELYAVMLIGALFGWRLGAVTVAAWLLEGALGLPVFAHGTGGLASFAGPTAGYLLSFPLVGAIAGLATKHGQSASKPLRVFAILWFAGLICLLSGWAWLSALIGAKAAWTSGVVPFLFGDAVKSALATATLVVWRSLRAHRS